jgi:hypothetical protein
VAKQKKVRPRRQGAPGSETKQLHNRNNPPRLAP